MKQKSKRKLNNQSGAAMFISIIFFLFIAMAIIFGLVSPTVRAFKASGDLIESAQSFLLSESVVEDSYFRLKNGLAIGATNTIVLGGSSATATITDSDYNEKTISALGDVNSRQRTSEVVLGTGVGTSFNYGMQVGNGGLTMENTSTIIGNVYVNGNITGSNSAKITGTAVAADRSAEVVDQVNDTTTPTHAIQFGDTTSTQDGAQSFIVTTSDVVAQVSLYIKKVGAPSNATVRITSNSSGKPASSSLSTGTLSASSVTTSYGWVNVVLSPNVTLSAGTTYWLVVDASTNASNYYIWGANDSQYTNGLGKLGQYSTTSWNNTSPSGLDAFFKIYLGGINSTISGMTIGESGSGDAQSHTVTNSDIAGNLYCQTGSGNNKSCNSSQGDPAPLNFPISDAQIDLWKQDAVAGGTQNGISLSEGTLLVGPKKINGNLSLSNIAELTVSGTLWVTGNVSLQNSSKIQLSSSYGSGSGMIIVDGTVSTQNTASFSGSGATGSYMMMLTTSTSSLAMEIKNSAGTVILVAPYGTITFSNTAGAKEAIAKNIHMENSATLTYESGLANVNFTSGPSGGWNIESWEEVR